MTRELRERKPLLGVDIDGCLYDFESAARAVLRQHGCSITSVESPWWDGLRDEVGNAAWEWAWANKDARRALFRGGPPFLDAIKTCRRLEQIVDLVIITHRPLDVADLTMRWLADHKLHPRALHFASGLDKGTIADCIGYVEDRADNAREIAATTGTTVWVPVRSYNAGIDQDGIFYFRDWRDVEQWAKQQTS